MDLVTLIGLVGSVASVIGILIAVPNWRSRLIHGAYGVFITILSAGVVYYHQQAAEEKDLEVQATKLLERTSDEGNDRAMMFATLALLEKHKEKLPDTYSTVKELCIAAGLVGEQKSDHRLTTWDGARAVRGLLEGLAAPKKQIGSL